MQYNLSQSTHAGTHIGTQCCAVQVLTQVSLILLLFGTIVGDFALISDVSARAFQGLAAPDTPPAWLVAYDGRGTMCLFAVAAVFPLCCLKGMRQVHVPNNSSTCITSLAVALFAPPICSQPHAACLLCSGCISVTLCIVSKLKAFTALPPADHHQPSYADDQDAHADV